MRILLVLLAAVLVPASMVRAQMPEGFRWIDLESDKATVAAVRYALKGVAFTAIREVGVEGDFALVMTVSRETAAPLADSDYWSIYNVALASGKTQLLLNGYRVQLRQWIGIGPSELAITYDGCNDCEGLYIFTTLHFEPRSGWRARWHIYHGPNNTPGARVDCGEPTGGEEHSDPVFAVLGRGLSFTVGSWCRTTLTLFEPVEGRGMLPSVDPRTGKNKYKVEDDVERYSIDPATGEDFVEKLTGAPALEWKREICTAPLIATEPRFGRDSSLCRNLAKSAAHPPADHQR